MQLRLNKNLNQYTMKQQQQTNNKPSHPKQISWLCKQCEHFVFDTCTGSLNACEDYHTAEIYPEYFDI